MTTTEPKTKKCSSCDKRKKLDHFFKMKRGRFGRQAWCKVCMREYRRDRRRNGKEG